jgi:hypothetical protein
LHKLLKGGKTRVLIRLFSAFIIVLANSEMLDARCCPAKDNPIQGINAGSNLPRFEMLDAGYWMLDAGQHQVISLAEDEDI